MSDASRDRAAVPTEEGEEDCIPSQATTTTGRETINRTSNVTLSALIRHFLTPRTFSTDIYYATNVVGQAHNANFGTNYGQHQIQFLICMQTHDRMPRAPLDFSRNIGSMHQDARYTHRPPPGDPDAGNTAYDHAQPSIVHRSGKSIILYKFPGAKSA
jgi:hypothetical protein